MSGSKPFSDISASPAYSKNDPRRTKWSVQRARGQPSATYQMKQLRCDSIGWVRVSPSKGSGSLIVGFDVAHELAAQVGNGFEDSAGNNVALDFGEPVFDLVEPGTISGGVMQRHVWMVGKEAIHEFGFVGGEVVYDEVDFLAGGLCDDDFLEKADELLAGVAAGSASDDLAASGLEGGIKGKGAVTEILKPMTLGPSRRERQHGIEPVEGLDGGLFVHAENGGMGRRGQIQSNDVGGFRFESWIVGSHEVAQPMRLQPVAPPDASDAHVPDAEFACQTTAAPVSAAVIGAAPRPLQHFGLQSGRIGSGLTPAMLGDQTAQACLPEAIGPTLNIRSATPQSPRDLAHALPPGTPQDDIGTASILGTHAARTQPTTKFTTFGRTQHQTFGCHRAIIATS
jgi:hypothetical protein